jgi:hypothetical protein
VLEEKAQQAKNLKQQKELQSSSVATASQDNNIRGKQETNKLNALKAGQIRQEYLANPKITMKQLGIRYGVTKAAISQVLRNETYSDTEYKLDPARFNQNKRPGKSKFGVGRLEHSQIEQIRAILEGGKETSDSIARHYGVDVKIISSIKTKLNRERLASGKAKLPKKRRTSSR